MFVVEVKKRFCRGLMASIVVQLCLLQQRLVLMMWQRREGCKVSLRRERAMDLHSKNRVQLYPEELDFLMLQCA